MSRYLIIIVLFFFTGTESLCFLANTNTISGEFVTNTPTPVFGFQENKGQMIDTEGNLAPYVLFKVATPGLDIYVTETGLTYKFYEFHSGTAITPISLAIDSIQKPTTSNWYRVDMVLKGASIKKENVITEKILSIGRKEYYTPHYPNGVFDVGTYEKIIIQNIYPGIDWVLYTHPSQTNNAIKYDFIIHPDATPEQIKLLYEGYGELSSGDNSVSFKNELGEVNEGELFCYQGNYSNEIHSSYSLVKKPSTSNLSSNSNVVNPKPLQENIFSYEIGIEIGNYDKDEDLIIDPELVWGTFYGGMIGDEITSLNCDQNGNLYAVGHTWSSDFPISSNGNNYTGTYVPVYSNLFFSKFTTTGEQLWSTYYSSSLDDYSFYSCVGPNGNLYITGYTESFDFPVFNYGGGSYFQNYAGDPRDAFILKFNGNGVRTWSTFYGGIDSDYGNSISTDFMGNVVLVGITNSTDFPTLDPMNNNYFDGTFENVQDGFIVKFNNMGERYWSTYYGGDGLDQCFSVCTDPKGNIFVGGYSSSSNLDTHYPGNGALFQPNNNGLEDGFILKFSPTGEELWQTYHGGIGRDLGGLSVKSDSDGNLFMIGYTSSGNMRVRDPLNGAYFQPNIYGPNDLMITKYDTNSVLVWGSYYGGNGHTVLNSFDNLAIDSCNNLYIGAITTASNLNLPASNACNSYYSDETFNGGQSDAYFMKFTNNGNFIWSTYFGGDGTESYSTLALDTSGNLFISANVSGAPVTNNTYPLINPGGNIHYDGSISAIEDGFLAKFIHPFSTDTAHTDVTQCSGADGTATITIDCGNPPYNFVWSNGIQTLNSWNATNTISGLSQGTYWVTATGNCNKIVTDTFTIKEPPLPSISATTAAILTCSRTSTTLSVSSNSINGVYSWSGSGIVSGGSSSSPIVNEAGRYTVIFTDTITRCTNDTSVDVQIDTIVPSLTINDVPILDCLNTTGVITSNSNTQGAIYSWAGVGIVSGGNTSSLLINLDGEYILSVTNPNNGCKNIDTVNVTIDTLKPNLTITPPPTLHCNNLTTILQSNTTSPRIIYDWVGPGIISGETTPNPVVNSSGVYSLTVIDTINHCQNMASITITYVSDPIANALENATIFSGQFTRLNASGGNYYEWTPSRGLSCSTCPDPLASPTITTDYVLTVTDTNGCSDRDQITIIVEQCGVYVPSAFSPNGDGINELECSYSNCVNEMTFRIFNRWGEVVFETNELGKCWDGTDKGKMVSSGIYVYTYKGTMFDGRPVTKKGNITVIK